MASSDPKGSGKPLQSTSGPSASQTPAAPPPPPPVIPLSILADYEQRRLFCAVFGLLEVIKIWDIVSPYFMLAEPTWSSHIRLSSGWTWILWTGLETTIILLVRYLRIPRLSPSPAKAILFPVLFGLANLVLWIIAEPKSFAPALLMSGPIALGSSLTWWPFGSNGSKHISGIHKIRILPFSTATLNPLSLSYCIPHGDSQPLFVPIVFNNSIPDEVSYYIRSLDTGHTEVRIVAGSSLRQSRSASSVPRLTANTDEDDEEEVEEITDPLSALILKSDHQELAKLPSVKPADSLSLVPPRLTATQSVRYLSIDRPSVISLKSVVDKSGDRFHITPHKEAIIIECPAGGDFVHEEKGKVIKKGSKPQPAESRCIGQEEKVLFQVRGVSPLRVTWRKKSKDASDTYTIEGIDSDIEPVDQLGLVRRDKVSKTHTVPIRVTHDRPGVHTISLTSVSDSMHNHYTPSGHSAERTFNVLSRPTIKFGGPTEKSIVIGGETSIPIAVSSDVGGDSVDITYAFKPVDRESRTTTIKSSKNGAQIKATEAGTYTLLAVDGQCGGTIIEPSSVTIQTIAKPAVEMDVTTLHECAMNVGSTVSFSFTGTPPFTVEYTEQKDNGRTRNERVQFRDYSGQFDLKPELEGSYTYSFVSLSDKVYKAIPMDQPPITQTVHPLASLELHSQRSQKLWACSGNSIWADFETKGANPLSLTFLVSYNGRTENTTWHIPPGRQKLSIPVPAELQDDKDASGKFTVAFVSIEDGNKCARKLNGNTIEVEVDRKRPTVRFAKPDKVAVTEGEVVKAALRLTGTAPWEVTYTHDGKPIKTTMRDANGQLTFNQKGSYQLTHIKDAHCPGPNPEADAEYEIDFKPKPSVAIIASKQLREEGGAYKHVGMCAGQEDSVAFKFNGLEPYELAYVYTSSGKTSRQSLQSPQENGILHLASEPGSHRYDFTNLKDANYPSNPVSLSLQHEVHLRPAVTFVKQNTKSICLDARLAGNARVKLSGKAPFQLGLAVRKPGSSSVESFTMDVNGHEWTLDLPYETKVVGRHEVTVSSITDASGCEWDVRDGDVLSTTVDVVESARIVPVSRETDLCVGDTLDFLLQGKAPWVIEYEWLGKAHKVESSEARFSRYAEKQGIFAIKSVALKDNQCKREVERMERVVHPLPTVKIQDGESKLRDGDEPAVFSVKFAGTAPFSFTYTRSEVFGKTSKVVDTQTITDIMEDAYTISSSLPGDYEVISIADKYCRYPRISRGKEAT